MSDVPDRSREAAQMHSDSLSRFMRQHPPFDRLPDAELQYLLRQARLVFHPAGSTLLHPDGEPVRQFFLLQQGRIQGLRRGRNSEPARVQFEIGVGECFPLAALLGERPTRTEHVAVEDVFCMVWSSDDFARLVRESESFREFALKGVSGLLAEVGRQMQQRAAGQLGSDFSMAQPIGSLLARQPVQAAPSLTLDDALKQMEREQVSSLVIVNRARKPIGIFTLRDLRRRLATEGWRPELPVSDWMTPSPIHLERDVPVFQAALVLAERGITHIVVTHQGRLQGVLSERDLFQLQRLSLVSLARGIRHATRLDQLHESRAALSQLVEQLLARGASAGQITQLIARFNDQLVQRVQTLVSLRLGAPAVAVTWLCFGSEAREEQTLHTDQDNGLWFDSEAQRPALLGWAEAVNRDLDALGLSWCGGGIMAGQPACCLTPAEWRSRFLGWLREPTPANLLNAVIFFDMRVVQGDVEAVETLRRDILDEAAGSDLFLRLLSEEALRRTPPLGRIRDFRLSKGGDHPHTFDLKLEGLTPLVDGARVLALRYSIPAVSTVGRLQALVHDNRLRAVDGEAYIEAFQHLQLLRLQLHHEQARDGQPLSNRLDPDRLNPLDRRILRECLRQVERLQEDVKVRAGL